MASWNQIIGCVEEKLEKTTENNFNNKVTYELYNDLLNLSVHVDDNLNIVVHLKKEKNDFFNNIIEIRASCNLFEKAYDSKKIEQALNSVGSMICGGLVLSDNNLEIRSFQLLDDKDSENNNAFEIIHFAVFNGEMAWKISQLFK